MASGSQLFTVKRDAPLGEDGRRSSKILLFLPIKSCQIKLCILFCLVSFSLRHIYVFVGEHYVLKKYVFKC